MKKTITATLFTLISSSVMASDWELVTAGSNILVFVDNESVRFSGSTAKIWVRWEFSEPREVEYSYPKKNYVESKNLELYSCVDRTTTTIQAIQYSDTGEVVHSASIKESLAQFSEVVPDTMGESVLQWVCKKRPRQKK